MALKPFPVDVARDTDSVADPAELDRLMPGIRRAWAARGFEPYGEELTILDQGLVHLSNAITCGAPKLDR